MNKYIYKVSDFVVEAVVVASSPEDARASAEMYLVQHESVSVSMAREYLLEADVQKLGAVTADVDFDSPTCDADHGVVLGVQLFSFK